MSRVIIFSTVFPAYHPRKGEPTFFVEKVLNSLPDKNNYYCCQCHICGFMGMSNVWNGGGQIADTGDYGDLYCPKCGRIYMEDEIELTETYYIGKYEPKHHTIRAGNRWKAGMKFSPRVWSGKPRRSRQIIIAPDIEIKKVWKFEVDLNGIYSIDDKYILSETDDDKEIGLAKNDGLDPTDFFHWFMPNYNKPKEFSGQILCWNKNIEY